MRKIAFLIALVIILLGALALISITAEGDSINYTPNTDQIGCPAFCTTKTITLCNEEYDVCVEESALFCNVKVGDVCELVFIKLT